MRKNKNEGFSIVELLIVLTIILIMSASAYFYLGAHQTLYKADDQALTIIDIVQEARQRSLTQRETLRVEIDLTENIVRLINEKTPDTVTDDVMVRQVTLLPSADIKINTRASDIDFNPPEPYETPSAQFRQSIYPLSFNNQVCTLRFQSNGTVVDAGDDEIGRNATQIGTTIHVWLPEKDNPNQSNVARGITVIGATGTVRLWEWDKSATVENKWKDSRRSAGYGG